MHEIRVSKLTCKYHVRISPSKIRDYFYLITGQLERRSVLDIDLETVCKQKASFTKYLFHHQNVKFSIFNIQLQYLDITNI